MAQAATTMAAAAATGIAAMASAKVTTRTQRVQWEARALTLAQARHLDGTACCTREHTVMRVYWTPNGDRRGAGYTVVFFPATRNVACPCPSGVFGLACGHAGAVIHAERQRERALAQFDTDVLAPWRRGFDW